MKIGLVTFHDHNYGSALQCFATQEYLKLHGYKVEVINQVPEYSLIKRYSKRIIGLLSLCVRYPSYAKRILSLFSSQRSSSLRITEKSETGIGRFNTGYINNSYHSSDGLKMLGESDEFIAFFSGSDQVWNGNRIDFYDLYFLRFAPSVKRISWAASFGGNRIATYNKKRYAKYLSEYNTISVREASAVDIVKELSGKDAVCLADPVTILSADQWRDIYKKYTSNQTPLEKYILFFFLDKPSNLAVKTAEQLSSQSGSRVVTFGYKQEEINNHSDGGPWEFLSMIDNAECVLTDSFHAMVFSLLLHKRFYVFDRQYVHKQSQASRIVDLLNTVDLSNRFEPRCINNNEIDFTKVDSFFEKSRNAFENYSSNVLSNQKGFSKSGKSNCSVKEFPAQCCGCGACADICHVKAITMLPDNSGHIYPHIDSDLCTDCGACRKICAFYPLQENASLIKDGYVACGKDSTLIRKSASGGAFATIAKHVIEQKGIVYGASLGIENGKVKCEHVAVDAVDELCKIQGSKYVQSSTCGIFPEIREKLKTGQLVLFGGTSCQVAALKGFLRKEYDNLLTVDLICHGVPSLKLLQDYLDYQSKQYKVEITDFRFRVREGRDKPYLTTTTTRDSNNNEKQHRVSLRNSAFYRLFMGRGGYRPSCYNCPFASINKPADITLGDYYFAQDEKELQTQFSNNELLSTIIVHTEKGRQYMAGVSYSIKKEPVAIDHLVERHEQLQHPSQITIDGNILFGIYRDKGFYTVQKAVSKRNCEMFIPSIMRRLLKRN